MVGSGLAKNKDKVLGLLKLYAVFRFYNNNNCHSLDTKNGHGEREKDSENWGMVKGSGQVNTYILLFACRSAVVAYNFLFSFILVLLPTDASARFH